MFEPCPNPAIRLGRRAGSPPHGVRCFWTSSSCGCFVRHLTTEKVLLLRLDVILFTRSGWLVLRRPWTPLSTTGHHRVWHAARQFSTLVSQECLRVGVTDRFNVKRRCLINRSNILLTHLLDDVLPFSFGHTVVGTTRSHWELVVRNFVPTLQNPNLRQKISY